ncbi:MAG: 3-deoxy-D-manno-octulosonic acid transferase, partial [Acidobacteriota bacterium]
ELAGGRPIVVAGSVHSVEEARQVVTAFEALGGGGRALLVLAPRLIPTIEMIAGTLKERRLAALRRSALPAGGARADVLLLDSLGELPSLYEIADAVFIGGTLGAHGGHNPAEAARFAVPVAAGPNMEQFLPIAETFDKADAWRRVGSAGELAAVWDGWLRDPAAAHEQGRRGQDLVERSRGAWSRTLEALAPLLGEVRRGA